MGYRFGQIIVELVENEMSKKLSQTSRKIIFQNQKISKNRKGPEASLNNSLTIRIILHQQFRMIFER